MLSSCGWLIIIGIILLIVVIWYFNRSNDQPIPNEGVVDKIINSNSCQTSKNDSAVDELISSEYEDLFDEYNIGPAAYDSEMEQNEKFDGYLEKKQHNMRRMESPYHDDDMSESKFMYKKKRFMRRTPEDIKDLFDVDKMLPQEIENGWFDTVPLQSTKKIRGTHMIHPKVHMGINTVGNSLRNASHDIRGDIPNPKTQVSPFNNSTIEPDTNIRGLCN